MYVIYGGCGRLSRVESNEILRRLTSWRRMKMTTVCVRHHSALSLATGFATLASYCADAGQRSFLQRPPVWGLSSNHFSHTLLLQNVAEAGQDTSTRDARLLE